MLIKDIQADAVRKVRTGSQHAARIGIFAKFGFGILALVTLPAASENEQFDLICTGSHNERVTGTKGTQVPWVGRFRIDLAQKQYCAESCTSIRLIERASPDFIVFFDQEGSSSIDRRNGFFSAWQIRSGRVTSQNPRGDPVSDEYKAVCEPAPFSGFTPRKF